MTRTKALLIVTPLVLVLAAVLLLPLLLDKDKILELATAQIKEQTGATLTVGGEIGLQLFPRIGISMADVSLAMPQEKQPGLNIRSLEIGLQLAPLVAGDVKVDSLIIDGLTSIIPAGEKDEKADTSEMNDDQLDQFYAQRHSDRTDAGDTAGSEIALAVPLALEVKILRLTDSRFELVDAAGAAPTVIELQSFEARDLNLDARPVKLEARIRMPGESPVTLELQGAIRIDQARQSVNLDALELSLTGATTSSIALEASGEIDINRQIADLQLSLQLAETQGEGSVRYASFESPLIDADMHFNLFDPALLALAGPQSAPAPQDKPNSGNDPLPLAALRGIDTRAKLVIDKALLGGHTVEDLNVGLRALDGIIRIDSLTGVVHGGQLALEGTFDAKHTTAKLATRGTLAGLDIADALAATDVDPIATGNATLEWSLAGKGRTQNELLAGLNGPIKLATEQVELRDIGIEGMLCKAVALTNQEALSASFPTSTRFQTLAADIQLTDGKALLQPLRAELAQVALTGTGNYELLSQDFKATFKARLSPELETLDRACRVSKRLVEIDWPLDCAGNANEDPAGWCSVDTQEIIEHLTKNEAKRKIEKKAGKLLEKLFN